MAKLEGIVSRIGKQREDGMFFVQLKTAEGTEQCMVSGHWLGYFWFGDRVHVTGRDWKGWLYVHSDQTVQVLEPPEAGTPVHTTVDYVSRPRMWAGRLCCTTRVKDQWVVFPVDVLEEHFGEPDFPNRGFARVTAHAFPVDGNWVVGRIENSETRRVPTKTGFPIPLSGAQYYDSGLFFSVWVKNVEFRCFVPANKLPFDCGAALEGIKARLEGELLVHGTFTLTGYFSGGQVYQYWVMEPVSVTVPDTVLTHVKKVVMQDEEVRVYQRILRELRDLISQGQVVGLLDAVGRFQEAGLLVTPEQVKRAFMRPDYDTRFWDLLDRETGARDGQTYFMGEWFFFHVPGRGIVWERPQMGAATYFFTDQPVQQLVLLVREVMENSEIKLRTDVRHGPMGDTMGYLGFAIHTEPDQDHLWQQKVREFLAGEMAVSAQDRALEMADGS